MRPSVDCGEYRAAGFFQGGGCRVASVPLADWKIYLRWHLIHSAAPALSAKFVDENFNFYGRTLTGHEGNASALAPLRGIDRPRSSARRSANIT